jgi:hypothetical protein
MTAVNIHSLQSPLIPIIFGYCIHEGEEYEIDIEPRVEKKTLRIIEKRHEQNSYLYVLAMLVDH